ncbi:MAG: hydratase, partial [Clostridiales bacterium]|nr:hydratase [Clostridiales bacterium]
EIRPMIALPFHPSNALPIDDFLADPLPRLAEIEARAGRLMKKGAPPKLSAKVRGGDVYVDQAVIAGCSGGLFENITDAADMLLGRQAGGGDFSLSVYPSSQPLMMALMADGSLGELMAAGASVRSAFCGPCFGAGDVPMHGGLSIRHTTRNFENREGARPSDGQIAYVALMDARSIAATAANGGRLTPADRFEWTTRPHTYAFNRASYDARVYNGWGHPRPEHNLVFGPNIADWPEMIALPENLLLSVASSLCDPVTTTDELIPSGETSSYRSNPMRLAEFALSRRDPGYVDRAKAEYRLERQRRAGQLTNDLADRLALTGRDPARAMADTGLGSLVFAFKPGDGSAREQAASCQRVLGGCANVAAEYATKRYRSNVVNWGMLPFVLDDGRENPLRVGDALYLPGIRAAIAGGCERVEAQLIRGSERTAIELKLPGLSAGEREVLLAGCLINYYRASGQ